MIRETDFQLLENKIINDDYVPTAAEAVELTKGPNRERLWMLADRLRRHFQGDYFDTCSIINARSGRCSEDCKWCAQSIHYKTDIDIYPLVDSHRVLQLAKYNATAGIRRFSFVTSGKSVTGSEIEQLAEYASDVLAETDMKVCASLGLVSRDDLEKLYDSGVTRYHCNIESAPSFFRSLCTTHTIDQKLETIRNAKSVGMSVCSGGIIGMGETMRQRVEFALELREVNPVSIPLNVLQPIPGTPLEHMPPLTDTEILDTVAIFRLVHPRVIIRFAGGRARISPHAQREALRIGVNGAIMGDLLTTIGAQIEQDKTMIKECGYDF